MCIYILSYLEQAQQHAAEPQPRLRSNTLRPGPHRYDDNIHTLEETNMISLPPYF